MAKRKEDTRVEKVIKEVERHLEDLYDAAANTQPIAYLQLQVVTEILKEMRFQRLGNK